MLLVLHVCALDFKKKICVFSFMSMSVFSVRMFVHHVHALCPQKSREDVGSLVTGVTDGYKPLCGVWKPNPGPQQQQKVGLTAEPPF